MNFIFNDKQYEYFDHPSNQTAVNERRVELPIAFEFANQFKEDEILEVGNVLSHYNNRYRTHDVVDLYEQVPWRPIINESIIDFKPKKKYKAVISISTLEHIDNQEEAIKKTLSLAPNHLITVPMGYREINSIINQFKPSYLMRVNGSNLWQQVTWNEAKDVHYGKYGNAIAIII